MTVAQGTNCYTVGAAPCSGAGLSWTAADLDGAINGPVASIVFDDSGKADIGDLLSSLADTQFQRDGVARILANTEALEDWRVGEAVAESYLIEHREALFPWPDGRDERKRGSSLPGADLVGFRGAANDARFAFGEVKTSGENKYPPGAMFGRTGLKQQLEDLRDDRTIRDDLVAYLAHRALKSDWLDRYKCAATRYLANPSDVYVFGILIRDVEPHQDDLRVRVEKLSTGCPSGTVVELFAIYLPSGSIAQLGTKVIAARKSGGNS
jgi:hypothetical protein